MSVIGQICGLASSTAYIRCGGSGTDARYVLPALAMAFGASSGAGENIYNQFNQKTGFSTLGFDNTSAYYNSVEQNVLGLGGDSQIGVAAIIYAYANFSNLPADNVVGYINKYCAGMREHFGELYPEFTKTGLEHTLAQFSVNAVNSDIASQDVPTQVNKGINYNWYDSAAVRR